MSQIFPDCSVGLLVCIVMVCIGKAGLNEGVRTQGDPVFNFSQASSPVEPCASMCTYQLWLVTRNVYVLDNLHGHIRHVHLTTWLYSICDFFWNRQIQTQFQTVHFSLQRDNADVLACAPTIHVVQWDVYTPCILLLSYWSNINITHSSTSSDHIRNTQQVTSMNTLWSDTVQVITILHRCDNLCKCVFC